MGGCCCVRALIAVLCWVVYSVCLLLGPDQFRNPNPKALRQLVHEVRQVAAAECQTYVGALRGIDEEHGPVLVVQQQGFLNCLS